MKTKAKTLPKVKSKNFDLKKFKILAGKVKKITDQEKKDGFLTNEYGSGPARYSF